MLRTAIPQLDYIQSLVEERLEGVVEELRRIVLSDFPAIEEVNDYLLTARGKLFRPMLLLLANDVGDRGSREAVTLASVVKLVHLPTFVHDDPVDHSVLRPQLTTMNQLW